jgi:hypothetical protein
MLTSYGVVGVVDTGSYLPNTMALRRRIEAGEIRGPAILTAGGGFAPDNGSPYYLLPSRLPELTRPEMTDATVTAAIDAGVDVIKLFTGSWATRETIVVMPVEIVRAAVEAAHRRGKLVFAHPSNSPGARAAIEGGVDVLAHTFPTERDGPWDRSLPGRMRERGMALVPTLKLWPYEGGKLAVPPAGKINRFMFFTAYFRKMTQIVFEIGYRMYMGHDMPPFNQRNLQGFRNK